MVYAGAYVDPGSVATGGEPQHLQKVEVDLEPSRSESDPHLEER